MRISHGKWDNPPERSTPGRPGEVELLEVDGNDTSAVILVADASVPANVSSTEGPNRSGNSEVGLDILREMILEP